MVKLLLSHNCEVDPVDDYLQTPLHKATVNQDVELCRILVSPAVINIFGASRISLKWFIFSFLSV